MSDPLDPLTPAPLPILTTAQALEQVVALLTPMPSSVFWSLTSQLNSAANLVWNNTRPLSDSQTPLTPQQIFTALGSAGGPIVAYFNAISTLLNSLRPNTIPAPPATTTDPVTGIVAVVGA